MKLSFSLNKPKTTTPAAPVKAPSLFSSADDDDDAVSLPGTSKPPVAPKVETSKAIRKRMEAEKQVDETVFEYDEVWDKMQEAKQKLKEVKEQDSKERKPKYIHNLLTSAATRKLDHLRAEEKMMQREREAEGDEFKDKEQFVTQAYKDQMEEVRRAEEEEKKMEELKKKQGGQSTGMAHFYRKLLEESEQKHEATVAATQKRVLGPQAPSPNLTITKPADFTPVSDLELARIAREQGKDVELNDDNQIVDKRELLAAGLNLSLPNTRRLGVRTPGSTSVVTSDQAAQGHRAVGTAASRREINERRAREIQQQMEVEELRLAAEKKEREDEALRRIITKRNNEDDVLSARERYLQRKRQKLEESASVTQGEQQGAT
ncbi:coiled-coil domain-containing protein 55-domain containing protein [Crucibulum laeve]|uniref:Coiled-coil domain-containing protein 55-domain containing protein n=1 Tax=Crucibulum laeve TaxID=68775 RepID=A0A5C3MCS6_9AGAR|nr:coiled-coil domain-containing protein 55-domain containing protein [Crucibulum laeve]